MSTIAASNLKDISTANTVAMVYPVQGSAKQWVKFNGTGTPAINVSLNTTSITDVTTGSYVVNFTTAFATADYAFTFGSRYTGGSDGMVWAHSSTAPTTTAVAVLTGSSAVGTAIDLQSIIVACLGAQ